VDENGNSRGSFSWGEPVSASNLSVVSPCVDRRLFHLECLIACFSDLRVCYGNTYLTPEQKRIFISNNPPDVTFGRDNFTKDEWCAIERRITEMRLMEGETLSPLIEEGKKSYLRPEGKTSSWEDMRKLMKTTKEGKVKPPSAEASTSAEAAKRLKVVKPSHCCNLSEDFSSPEYISNPYRTKKMSSNGSSKGSRKVNKPSPDVVAAFNEMITNSKAGLKLIQEADEARRKQEAAYKEHLAAEKRRTMERIRDLSEVLTNTKDGDLTFLE